MNKRPTRRLACALLLLAGALPFSIVAAGCGAGAGHDYCDKKCKCKGCSQADTQNCYNAADDLQKTADTNKCSQVYDDAAKCYDDNAVCNYSGVGVVGCTTQITKLGNCVGLPTLTADAFFLL